MYDPLSPTGVEIAKIKVHTQPSAEALAALPIADLWDIIWADQGGRTGVQLAVGGAVTHTSDWLIGVDAAFRWVRTATAAWRLGWLNDAYPPIVQTAMWPDRRRAYEHALARTGDRGIPTDALAPWNPLRPGGNGINQAITRMNRHSNDLGCGRVVCLQATETQLWKAMAVVEQ